MDEIWITNGYLRIYRKGNYKMVNNPYSSLVCYAKGIVQFAKVGHYTKDNKNYDYLTFSLKVAVTGRVVFLKFICNSRNKTLWEKVSQLSNGDCITANFSIGTTKVVRGSDKPNEYYPNLELVDFDFSDRRFLLNVNVSELKDGIE